MFWVKKIDFYYIFFLNKKQVCKIKNWNEYFIPIVQIPKRSHI
jgi:hypothetical protein